MTKDTEDIIRRIAYRNYQERLRMGFHPRNEFERKSFEEGDWISAVEEVRLFHGKDGYERKVG